MIEDTLIFGSLIIFVLMLKFNEKPIYKYLLDLKSEENTDYKVAINYAE